MRHKGRAACICLLLAVGPARGETLVECPAPAARAELAAAAGRGFDSLQKAIDAFAARYGQPHSLKRISDHVVSLVYRSGKGAVGLTLSRDFDGTVQADCVAY